jgi:phosphoribosylformylglycinamidine synthase II
MSGASGGREASAGRAPVRVSEATAAEQGLTADEYQRILALLGRVPTFEELAIFGVMWSEHCSYKSSKAHLRELPTTGPQVLQGPGENAGAVDIGDGLAAVFKIESHNHPSFVEPFQGAATGVGGILRDVFTMGARPIAILDSLRFGDLRAPRTPYLVRGVVGGIGHYGNCIGVATVGGDLFFDAGYDRNVLVNAFTIGIAPRERLFRASAGGPGNPVMYVGARTGRDGIHGASLLASAALDATEGEGKRPAVQVGDPFCEKLLLEACLELMATDYIVAIQDMGAAGLTSSSVEMAARGGAGLRLDLDRVPLREEGMTPYEILLSESQERMLLVARRGSEEAVQAIFRRWDLEAVVIGEVTADGVYRVRWHGDDVVALPVAVIGDSAPVYQRPAVEPGDLGARQTLDTETVPVPPDLQATLLALLESPNLCSREWVYEQYDQLVGGNTVVRPGGDAALVRVEGTRRALALAVDCNSRFTRLDPYLGAMMAVVEAARNCVVVGARPLAVTDCLNYGNPENPEVMWQFQQGVAGIRDACVALGTPVVSGNVSFYNETDEQSVPPTPTIAMVGLLEDVALHVTPWWKAEGDVIALLGQTREELGGSEYLAVVHGRGTGAPPWIDLETEKRLHEMVLAAVRDGLLRSAHDVAEGGLAIALSEGSFGGLQLGIRVAAEGGMRPDCWLFGESQSRVVVSARRKDVTRLRELAAEHGVPFATLGEVRGRRIVIGDVIDVSVETCHDRWRGGLARLLRP